MLLRVTQPNGEHARPAQPKGSKWPSSSAQGMHTPVQGKASGGMLDPALTVSKTVGACSDRGSTAGVGVCRKELAFMADAMTVVLVLALGRQ